MLSDTPDIGIAANTSETGELEGKGAAERNRLAMQQSSRIACFCFERVTEGVAEI
jgi:hypothetical protein